MVVNKDYKIMSSLQPSGESRIGYGKILDTLSIAPTLKTKDGFLIS